MNRTDYEQARRANDAGWKTPFVPTPKSALFIDVITAGTDPDAPPEQTARINYNNPVSRDWLGSHMTWALNTGRTVHLAAVDKPGPIG